MAGLRLLGITVLTSRAVIAGLRSFARGVVSDLQPVFDVSPIASRRSGPSLLMSLKIVMTSVAYLNRERILVHMFRVGVHEMGHIPGHDPERAMGQRTFR